jgi:hypothetical protein
LGPNHVWLFDNVIHVLEKNIALAL